MPTRVTKRTKRTSAARKSSAKGRTRKVSSARGPAKRASSKRTTTKRASAKRSTVKKSGSARVASKKTSASAVRRKSTVSAARRTSGSRASASSGSLAARGTAVGRGRSAKRSPNAAFMRPMQPDAALAAVVGPRPMPRTQITKKLWVYIKKNGLQDANQRRIINADPALRQVFGGQRRVDMFQMTRLVNRHMSEI